MEKTFPPQVAIIDVINVNIHEPSLPFPGNEFEKLPPDQLPAIKSPPLPAPQQPSDAQDSQPPYAAQRASDRRPPVYNSQSLHSSGGVSEEHVPLNAEAQDFDDEMPPDYGFVVQSPPEEWTGRGSDPLVPPQPPVPPVTGHNSYMAQSNVRPGQSAGQSNADEDGDQEEDEDGPTVIDWNPTTGVLHIPELNSMPLLGARREVELEEDIAVPRSIFSSLMMRQPSLDSYESEDGLCKMETVWQLQVNMEE